MKVALAAALAAAAVLGVFLVLSLDRGNERPAAPALLADPQSAREIDRLSAELDRLAAEVRRLSLERAAPSIVSKPFEAAAESGPARARSPSLPPQAPSWYLDQYVLSFEGGGNGSEYFRLAVDAYARELVAPMVEIVLDSTRPAVLRKSLIAMLGTRRFSGQSFVVDALLATIRGGDARDVAQAALKALPVVGGPGTVAALERIAWSVPGEDLAVAVLRAIAHLAGDETNAVLLRLLTSAPSSMVEPLRILISLLNGADPASALQCFVVASRLGQPVRLMAANRIADFPDKPFKDYVAEWLGFERDEQVREALKKASQQQAAGKSWHASRAIGPPDANPEMDDPNAWASASPDGGLEWLELDYTPMRASSVRIYEVNARGAVVEVRARGPDGSWRTVWSGTAAAPSGPLVIEFPATDYPVGAVRIVLDTRRTSGWNEIDAVELVGPDGRAWASGAHASSNYGS